MRTTVTSENAVKGARRGAGASRRGAGGGGKPPKSGGDEPWPPGFTRDDAIEPSKFRIGMWVAMASILMLFVSLTSAYVLRQSKGPCKHLFGPLSRKLRWRREGSHRRAIRPPVFAALGMT